jgi:UDP-2,3-diacylglucosamine hydrolase
MQPALPTPAYILSDAHLGVADAASEAALLAFAKGAARDAKTLVINGDLFDFWFTWSSVMPRVGYRVLAALADLCEADISVVWIAGNHDCWGGAPLVEAGAIYHVGPWRGTIGRWETLIEHGDGLRDKEDAPYRRLRAVLRHPLSEWAFRHLLHPDWAAAIARASSHTSRTSRARDGGDGLRRVALDRLANDSSLDLYVFGHSHAESFERAPGGGVYANPGAWLAQPTALRVTDGAVEIGSAAGGTFAPRALLPRAADRPTR